MNGRSIIMFHSLNIGPDWPGGVQPVWNASEEKWDRFYNSTTHTYEVNERVNYNNNLGKLKGTDVKISAIS